MKSTYLSYFAYSFNQASDINWKRQSLSSLDRKAVCIDINQYTYINGYSRTNSWINVVVSKVLQVRHTRQRKLMIDLKVFLIWLLFFVPNMDFFYNQPDLFSKWKCLLKVFGTSTLKGTVSRDFWPIFLPKRFDLGPIWTGKNGFAIFFVFAKILAKKRVFA